MRCLLELLYCCVALSIFGQQLVAGQNPTCTCQQLDSCVGEQQNTNQLQNAVCRDQCTARLTDAGITNTAAVLQCFQSNELAKTQTQNQIRTCVESTSGQRPCTNNFASTNQQVLTSNYNNNYNNYRQGNRRKRGGGFMARFGSFGGFPQGLNDFQRCTSQCFYENTFDSFGFGNFGGNRGFGGFSRGGGYRRKRHAGVEYFQCSNSLNCNLDFGNDMFGSFDQYRTAFCTCNQQTNYTALFQQQYTSLCSCLQQAAPGQTFNCANNNPFGSFDPFSFMCNNDGLLSGLFNRVNRFGNNNNNNNNNNNGLLSRLVNRLGNNRNNNGRDFDDDFDFP